MDPGLKRLAFVATTLCALLNMGSGLKINDDGGYEITVAFEESTSVSDLGVSVSRYIDNMKISFGSFSSLMWTATKTRFYLKSINVLIPSNWTVDSSLSATTQSYQSADIRLSPRIIHPRVDNPNLCGQPGNFIELPHKFFNITNSGPYGPHRKSLLHTWAIYRFGVHPEHGFLGNSKYPYAVRDVQSQEWKVTGCSNEKITGKFIDTADSNVNCETGSGLKNSCRFVPNSTGQNATSSLMHFHWIDSISEFCDEHAHNKFAQNKQNALCDYKSVWEVITESPDYLAVKSPRKDVPRLTFNVVQHSATPLFYVLLDRGRIQGSFSIAGRIPPLLARIFGYEDLQKTVAAIGAYPGNSPNQHVQDLVDWSEIGKNSNKFIDEIGTLKANGPTERDFSRALKEVAENIKAKNHPNGAVVLLIKYGADTKNFGSYLPEAEVLHSFNEGNVIFNAIELDFEDHATGFSHLAGIAKGTGGSYTVVNNQGEVEATVLNVLGYVRRTLRTEYTDLRKNYKILSKDSMSTTSTIPVPNDLTGSIEIFLSSFNPNLQSSNIEIFGYGSSAGVNPRELQFRFAKTLDWNEAGSKFTYRLDIPKSNLNNINQIRLRIICTSGDCSSNILARAQFSRNLHEVEIHVSTSVENGFADLSNGKPISVFAKVTKKGLPVRDAVVIATLTETLSSKADILRLVDNGEATPDVEELDGVYSAYFAPVVDGQYKLTVTVEGTPPLRKKRSIKKTIDENALIRLLPIDQGDMGCGMTSCDPETIDEHFSQTVELPIAINISNAWNYRPQPTKTRIMAIVDRPDLGQLTLYWQTPSIPGRLHSSASSYVLRSAPSRENLISAFDNQTEIPIPPNIRPGPPATLETFVVARPSVTTYYAVKSIYFGKQSAISNIVEASITAPTTSTPPSSSSSSPSSSTTTDGTTVSGPSSTTTGPSSSSTAEPTGSTSSTNPTTPGDQTTSSEPPTTTTTRPTNPPTTTPEEEDTSPISTSPEEDTTESTTKAMGHRHVPEYSISILIGIFAFHFFY